ncbi:hypothetical protein [Pseudomonas rubra]|uniref:DUF697 domain-containing protein n=1 Tax=Pseudomonas rubra TaxID=2942627 RepID=A0ABT5PDC5_9PSED|nr:hypothetical protein [Pseudomonas rubra]MDD1015964.1 hypothetical protein [Pseudomonas rubra]MDD1039265.1 hypothetical protein [Pseudomonas rubra]MDD1155235.1 hypothetical protein [Pseudomonas rubra]
MSDVQPQTDAQERCPWVIRELTVPAIPEALASAIGTSVLETLDSALALDRVLEQSQHMRAAFHELQVEHAVEALSASIQAYLSEEGQNDCGYGEQGTSARELCEVFEDALEEVGEGGVDVRCSLSESPSQDEYFDAYAHFSAEEPACFQESAVAGRLSNVLKALERIAHNDFEAPAARRLSNAANLALQSFISVGLPAFVRQAVAYAIESALHSGQASMAARTTLGAVAGSLPLLLGAAGMLRDNLDGVATGTSNLSRGTCLLIGSGVMVAAGINGSLATLASTLAAYNLVYATLSEGIHSWLRVQDNANALNARAAAMITASSVINTMAARQASAYGASSSGAGQGAQGLGWQPLADLSYGVLSFASSTAGGLFIHAWRYLASSSEARQDVRLSLVAALPTRGDLVQRLLGKYSLGGSASTNSYLLDDMLAPFITATNLSQAQILAVRDALVAVIAGGQYPLMVGAQHYRKPPQPPGDPEAGTGQPG